MNYHYNPSYDLINENINHDMSRNKGPQGDTMVGHAPETLWFVMAEAVRIKDKDLFILAANRLKRHIEVLWDDVYGGYLLGLTSIENNSWNIQKALWLQEEILIGTMMITEHLGEEWAREWFGKSYTYVRNKFVLKQYGYPLWIAYADRKVTFVKDYDRVENYHHPRHLMINLLSLERMIKRGGKTSGIFA
jgi:N-acylglucosamine 2-epimerase